MRLSPPRFAWLVAAFLVAPACNSIFGITDGVPGGSSSSSTSTGGTGGGIVTGDAGTGDGSTGDGSTGDGSTGDGSAGDGGTDDGGLGEGGAPCTDAGTAWCDGSVLTVCDGTGHTQSPVDCGAAALCDVIGEKCNDFGRLGLGSNRACAVDDNHGVHCWGFNHGSPLAGGSLVLNDIHAMFVEPQTITGVSAWQIAVADAFQCALQQNGDVSCWGEAPYGELATTPSYVVGSNPKVPLDLPAVEIGNAYGCACARLNDGSVWCWGLMDQGCHGDGTSGGGQVPGPTPTQIPVGKNAVQIRIGDGAVTPSCARLVSKEVYCWGQGYGPTIVPGVSDATDIAVGPFVVFIRRPAGVYWSALVPPSAGGADAGDGGSALSFTTPVAFTGASGSTMMAAGVTFCTAGTGPTVTCTPLYSNQPPVPGFQSSTAVTAAGTIAEIAAGYGADGLYSTTLQCLRLSGVPFAQSVYCWGDDANGTVGSGGPDYFTSPASVTIPVPAPAVSSLSCAEGSTVVALTDGSVRYWGYGVTYIGNGAESVTPSPSLTTLGTGNKLVRGDDNMQIAYGVKTNGTTPSLVINGNPVTNQRLQAFTASSLVDIVPSFVDLGLTASHEVIVYAESPGIYQGNACGIFGDGTTTTVTGVPHLAPLGPPAGGNLDGGTLQVASISAYVNPGACPSHACAIDTSGALWCWGSNYYGESAYATAPPTAVVTSPTQVIIPGVTKPFTSVAKGYSFTCATDGPKGTGQVYCWGRNDYGQLGIATFGGDTPIPAPVFGIMNSGGTVPALGVVAGQYHACAWLNDGSVTCWGNNDYGQLGIGNFDDQDAPAPIPTSKLTNVVGMSAGDWHTCALRGDGTVACWGSSYTGQVGTGVNGQLYTPQKVLNLP